MKIKRQQRSGSIDTIFVFLVFTAFATTLLVTLFLGVNIYKSVGEKSSDSYDRTLCMRYIAAKLQHNDSADSIYVSTFEDNSALVIMQKMDDINYETKIYLYDGYVRELMCEQGSEIEPSEGNEIMPGNSLVFNEKNGIISAKYEDSTGRMSDFTFSLRSRGDGQNKNS